MSILRFQLGSINHSSDVLLSPWNAQLSKTTKRLAYIQGQISFMGNNPYLGLSVMMVVYDESCTQTMLHIKWWWCLLFFMLLLLFLLLLFLLLLLLNMMVISFHCSNISSSNRISLLHVFSFSYHHRPTESTISSIYPGYWIPAVSVPYLWQHSRKTRVELLVC